MDLSVVLAAIGAFCVGAISLYGLLVLAAAIRKKQAERKRVAGKNRRSDSHKPKKTAKKSSSFGKMDLILVIMGATLTLFTLKMIQLFEMYQTVPDTLITMVFGVCGGECGVMGWIKTTKERQRERGWQMEDEQRRENLELSQGCRPIRLRSGGAHGKSEGREWPEPHEPPEQLREKAGIQRCRLYGGR